MSLNNNLRASSNDADDYEQDNFEDDHHLPGSNNSKKQLTDAELQQKKDVEIQKQKGSTVVTNSQKLASKLNTVGGSNTQNETNVEKDVIILDDDDEDHEIDTTQQNNATTTNDVNFQQTKNENEGQQQLQQEDDEAHQIEDNTGQSDKVKQQQIQYQEFHEGGNSNHPQIMLDEQSNLQQQPQIPDGYQGAGIRVNSQQNYRVNANLGNQDQQQQQQMNAQSLPIQNNQIRPFTKQQRNRTAGTQNGNRQRLNYQVPQKQVNKNQDHSRSEKDTTLLRNGPQPQNQQYGVRSDKIRQNEMFVNSFDQQNTYMGYDQQQLVQNQQFMHSHTNTSTVGQGGEQYQVKPMYPSNSIPDQNGNLLAVSHGLRVNNLVSPIAQEPFTDPQKRRRLRELILGQGPGGAQTNGNYLVNNMGNNQQNGVIRSQSNSMTVYKQIEKEELQNQQRNLKIQFNVTRDENIRLKTKQQIMLQDLHKKEKEIETLTYKLQKTSNTLHSNSNNLTRITTAGGNTSSSFPGKNNYMEIFIVSQLKKQNRDLRMEIQEKDKYIEQYKRNIKLCKVSEVEAELQMYIEECLRLRGLLEQTILEKDQAVYQQNNVEMHEQYQAEDQARIEEAFYEKEIELQRERQTKNNLEVQVISQKEQSDKLLERLQNNEKRMKNYNNILNENKRKQKIIVDKTKELMVLKQENNELKKKAKERDHIHQLNKDLVTRNCGLTSNVQNLRKQNDKLTSQVQQMEEKIRSLENDKNTQPLMASNVKGNAQSPMRGTPNQNLRKKLETPIRESNQSLSQLRQSQKVLNNQDSQKMTQSELLDQKQSSESQDLIWSQPLATQVFINLYQGRSPDQNVTPKDQSRAKQHYLNHKEALNTLVMKIKQENSMIGSSQWSQIVSSTSIDSLQSIKSLSGDKLASFQSVDHFARSALEVTDQKARHFIAFELIYKDAQTDQDYNLQLLVHAYANPQSFISQFNKRPNQTQEATNLKKEGKAGSPPLQITQDQKQDQERPAFMLQQDEENEEEDYSNDQFDGANQLSNQKSEDQDKQEQKGPKDKKGDHDDYGDDEYEQDEDQQQQDNSFANKQAYPKQQPSQNQEQQNQEDLDDNMISENEMLDVAESVFQKIAKALVDQKKSIRETFGTKVSILEEFEGEENVALIMPNDFLDTIQEIGVSDLINLDIACIMRVLSKPEMNDSIKLDEFEVLMANFGCNIEPENNSSILNNQHIQQSQEDINLQQQQLAEIQKNQNNMSLQQNKDTHQNLNDNQHNQSADQISGNDVTTGNQKKKSNKKKQLQDLIDNEDSPVYEQMIQIVKSCSFEDQKIKQAIQAEAYNQLVKSKKKESNIQVITKENFLLVTSNLLSQSSEIKNLTPEALSEIEPLVCLNPKFNEIYQVKQLMQLVQETIRRFNELESEKQKIANFYKGSSSNNQKLELLKNAVNEDDDGEYDEDQNQMLEAAGHNQQQQKKSDKNIKKLQGGEVMSFNNQSDDEEDEQYQQKIQQQQMHQRKGLNSGGPGIQNLTNLNPIEEDVQET